jgi:hypothetical protein
MDRIAALSFTGSVHFFRLKKIGSRKVVYPDHAIGEARMEAIIPKAEANSGYKSLADDFDFVK